MHVGLPGVASISFAALCGVSSCSTPDRSSSPAREPPAEAVLARTSALPGDDSHRPLERALTDAYIPWDANEVLSTVGKIAETLNFSSYSAVTRVNVARGEYSFDCSGMADWVLCRAAPAACRSVRSAAQRPLARDFHRAIAAVPAGREHGGWRRIARVDQAEPGDVVAWIKPPEVPSRNSGHVAFIVRAPAPLPGYENAYLVRVADSTSLYHDNDTREPGLTDGFGFGTILLVSDESGAPVAYGWVGTRARVFETKIAIGRALR